MHRKSHRLTGSHRCCIIRMQDRLRTELYKGESACGMIRNSSSDRAVMAVSISFIGSHEFEATSVLTTRGT
jgi:hypothetical protein